MDAKCMEMMKRAYSSQMPFASMHAPFYLLIEVFERQTWRGIDEGEAKFADDELFKFLDRVSHLIEVSTRLIAYLYRFKLRARVINWLFVCMMFRMESFPRMRSSSSSCGSYGRASRALPRSWAM